MRRSLAHLLLGSLIGLLAGLLLPASAFAIDEFPLPTPNSGPTAITAGPDGALWFTQEFGNRIGRITSGGVVTQYGPTGTVPSEITPGPDGRLWFTEFGGDQIGAITTGATPTITEYPLPAGSTPEGIVAGPDGRLWFTEFGMNRIGRITTDGNTINHYPIPTSSSAPGDITLGPEPAGQEQLWFSETALAANKIGRIDPRNPSNINDFGIPTPSSDPSAITASFGALWFTEFNGNQIGRISTSGLVTNEFPIPTGGSGPSEITLGSDGALWFTESNANKIGRMTTSGSFTEFPVPSTAPEGPDGIAAGSDGALWFTEKGANKIGRIVPAPPFVPPPPPPPVLQQAAPRVLSLRLSPKAFRAAPRGSSISAKRGTTVTYRLSAAATTGLTVERETVGRKKGRKCVRPTPRNRRAKRCKLYKQLRGSFSHSGKAGNNKFRFSGRVGAKRLRPGRYRLVAVVGSNKSSRKRASFRIVRR